jgi:capsular polysaccharide biosynthesis protein
MINVIIGFVLGFFVATVGFTGVAQALDKGVETAKNISIKVDSK